MAKENRPVKGDNLLFYASGPVPLHKVRPLTPEEIKAACERWRQTFRDSLENNDKESSKVMIVHGDRQPKVEFIIPPTWKELKEQFSQGLIGKITNAGTLKEAVIVSYNAETDKIYAQMENGIRYWRKGEDVRNEY